MHRMQLLSLLENYRTSFNTEAGYVNRVRRFVEQHENCFDRLQWPGHITGSAWVINPTRDKVLLMHHRKHNQWFQFGGHADGDSNIIRVALRETQEETGWKFTPEALLGVYLWPQPNTGRTFLRFAFCGTCSDHQPEQQLDEGILQALWMSKDELQSSKNLRSPMVMQNIEDYLSGRRYPLEILSTVNYEK